MSGYEKVSASPRAPGHGGSALATATRGSEANRLLCAGMTDCDAGYWGGPLSPLARRRTSVCRLRHQRPAAAHTVQSAAAQAFPDVRSSFRNKVSVPLADLPRRTALARFP